MEQYITLILIALTAGMIIFVLLIVSAMAGAWIHNKGVSAGSGINPNFVGSPKGDVFSIPDPGEDFPGEGEVGPSESPSESEQHVLSRASQFMQRFGKDKE